jgi:hypothetical protein
MKLLTDELLQIIPGLYDQDGKEEQIAYIKFFTPDANWSWFAMEYDKEKELFFGLVNGLEKELGYFSLHELEGLKGPLGLSVERDIYFKPIAIKELR